MSVPSRSSWPVVLMVGILLAVHYVWAVTSKRNESVTFDELAHVTAGTSYWQFDDYRLQPENGVLPQRWAALPAWLSGARLPSPDDHSWKTSDVWALGHHFFYESGRDHFPMLMAARAMIAIFSVATGLLIFGWSRSLFGNAGGLVSLAFFAFSPNFLAHGALATSDMCITFFMLASVGAWWRHLNDGRTGTALLSMLAFGLACVAKFSAVLLLPMLAIMAVIRLLSPRPLSAFGKDLSGFGPKALGLAGSAAAHAAAAFLVIWIFYGLRFSAFNPDLPPPTLHFIRDWAQIEARTGLAGQAIRGMQDLHLLPEAFLYGASYVIDTSQLRSAFLNGEFSNGGWPSFFPWAFALKSTIPFMIACLLGLGFGLQRCFDGQASRLKPLLYRTIPLMVLFGVYAAFSITSHLNIGDRHLLPIYPVLFIGLGCLGSWLTGRRRALSALIGSLMAWQAAEAALVSPHFIAYFNELAGGPQAGHLHLVDSSLDWGQDLPGLKAWLDSHASPDEPVFLSYFGSGEPDYYGIRAARLNGIDLFRRKEPPGALKPGIYCISATCLSHVYSPFRGPWNQDWENQYQGLKADEPVKPDGQPHDSSERRLGQLRFARLCEYLRARKPDAAIGYSIFIYRLDAHEISAVTQGSLGDLRSLIEQARSADRSN